MPKTPKKKDRKKMLPMLPINKNGYVKKGFELDGTRTSDKEDGGSPRDRITLRQGEEREKYGGKGKKREVDGEDKKPELYHVHEMTMSHTVEKLEDGGKRTGMYVLA